MATTKFLDGEGLKILWKRIRGKFLPLSGGTVTGTIKAPGFVHSQYPSSSQHVLLANGGTTHISTLGGSGSGSYLPLSGGTMNNGSTIIGKNLTISNSPSENDWGDLYLGNTYNNGMIAVQTDMYGLDKSITGKNTWNIYTNGSAEFESLTIGGKNIGDGTITAAKFKVNGGTSNQVLLADGTTKALSEISSGTGSTYGIPSKVIAFNLLISSSSATITHKLGDYNLATGNSSVTLTSATNGDNSVNIVKITISDTNIKSLFSNKFVKFSFFDKSSGVINGLIAASSRLIGNVLWIVYIQPASGAVSSPSLDCMYEFYDIAS